MKQLNRFINEKLRISSKNKVERVYTCQARDAYELREIIKERLEDDKDADLNDIDVSQITNFQRVFANLDPHNIDVSEWDVSNAINMMALFEDCANLNCDLSDWDVRNVINMCWAFRGCKNFNGYLGTWDVFNVKDTYGMFDGCISFEGKGLNNWDMHSIRDMRYMFWECKNFKCDLSDWKIRKNKKIDMEDMFKNTMFADNPPKWYHK